MDRNVLAAIFLYQRGTHKYVASLLIKQTLDILVSLYFDYQASCRFKILAHSVLWPAICASCVRVTTVKTIYYFLTVQKVRFLSEFTKRSLRKQKLFFF